MSRVDKHVYEARAELKSHASICVVFVCLSIVLDLESSNATCTLRSLEIHACRPKASYPTW